MNSNKQRGVGLIEALVAFLVVGIGIAALVKLEGIYLQSSSESKARTVALSLAQEKLDDLRGFTKLQNDNFDYLDIAGTVTFNSSTQTYTCTGCTGGSLDNNNLIMPSGTVSAPDSNVTYWLGWNVENGYWCSSATTVQYSNCSPAKPSPDQKRVTVTVSWVDQKNATQSVRLQGIIAALAPQNTDALIDDDDGAGSAGKPQVIYTPSTDQTVVAIATSTGQDTHKETLTPVTSGGTTSLAAQTYKNVGGQNILQRTENFMTVACECRFDGTGEAYTAAHPKWSAAAGTFVDVEGEKVSKTIGCVQGGGSNCASNPDQYCSVCCRDHHDTNAATFKYDPYRGSGDFTNGNHNHYLTDGGSAVTSGAYLESCRLKMVNGYWRVYQDWHMVEHNIVPLELLDNSNSEETYATFVQDVLDAHIDESKVAGETLTSSPSEPAILTSSVHLSAVGAQKQLSGRGIYLDFMDAEHLAAIQQKRAAGVDYLLHVPFYELDVTVLSNWTSAIARGNASDKVDVGYYKKTGSGAYEIQKGQIRGIAATTGTPEAVTSQIKKSNSGLAALTSPDGIDFNTAVANYDKEKHSDSINVCVADSSGSCASTTTTTTTAATTSTTASTTTTTAATTSTTASTTTTTAATTSTTASTTSTTASTTSSTGGTTTTTTTLATCDTIISGKANNKNDNINVYLNGSLFGACSVNTNKDYTCPTVTSGLSAAITVTSSGSVNGTRTITPICGAKTINF